MKKRNRDNWKIDKDTEGLLYFAQRIDEMLFHYTIDTYKGRIYNTFMLCIEAVSCIKSIESGAIKTPHIEHIIDELNWSAKSDEVVKHLLKTEYSMFFPINAKLNLKELESLLVIILIRLLPANYEKANRELLASAVKSNKKKDIEKLLDSWLCIIQTWGYDETWLYNHIATFFFGSNKIENNDTIDLFLETINFKKNDYDIYFVASKAYKGVIQNTQYSDEFSVLNNLPTNISNRRLFKISKKQCLYKLNIKGSLDCYSAYEMASSMIESIRDLFLFFFHKSKPNVIDKFLIVKDGDNEGTTISDGISPMARGFDNDVVSTTRKIKTLLSGNAPSEETQKIFSKIFDLHSLCIDSSNKNNQLLNLWTAIEILIPIDYNNGKDKIIQISEAISAVSSLGYAYKLLRDLSISLRNWNLDEYKSFISHNNVSENEIVNLLGLVILSEFEPQRNDLFSKLNDFPLLRNKIFTLNKKFSKREYIKQTLEAHEQKISWQIRRLYRARNSIVHDAELTYKIDSLITNAHSYIDETLLLMLRLIQKEKCISSIDQGMKYIELTFKHNKKLLADENLIISKDNYTSFLIWK